MRVVILPLLAAALLSGCAGVSFRDASGKETGFLYYPPKPYLLVTEAEKGLAISLITIPDTTRPMYVEEDGFLGSSTYSFSVEHGMLTEFSNTVDSGTADIVSAVSTLLGTLGVPSAELTASMQSLKPGLYEIHSDAGKITLRAVPVE